MLILAFVSLRKTFFFVMNKKKVFLTQSFSLHSQSLQSKLNSFYRIKATQISFTMVVRMAHNAAKTQIFGIVHRPVKTNDTVQPLLKQSSLTAKQWFDYENKIIFVCDLRAICEFAPVPMIEGHREQKKGTFCLWTFFFFIFFWILGASLIQEL